MNCFCTRNAATVKTGYREEAQSQTPFIPGQASQIMAKENIEVGEHSREVRGSDHGATVSAHHRILQTAGARGGIDLEGAVLFE